MVWGKQGHAPCRTSHSKNPHGSHLLWEPTSPKVGVGGTYHKKKGASPHPGACKYSLQYDGWPDVRFGVQIGTWNLGIGTWNLGILMGRRGEVCEELRKRMIDVCCFQEVRWRGQGARMLGMKGGRYKLWWSGKEDGVGGVGVIVMEEQCEDVVEVRRASDRVMTVGVVFEEDVLWLTCGYAAQSGRCFE